MIESSFSSGSVSSQPCRIDLTPRSNADATTAAKPRAWKLISPPTHIITPPHIGIIERYAPVLYFRPAIVRMRMIVKSGVAAETICANDT